MSYRLYFFVLLLIPFFSNIPGMAQSPSVKKLDNRIVIEDFSNDAINQLPRGWYNRDGEKMVREYGPEKRQLFNYKVLEEHGNKFLRYEGKTAMHMSFPLINEDKDNIYNINIYKTPILTWKVRAYNLPKNGNEENDDTNDSVASVYVFFEFGRIALFKKVPKTIRYSWSTSLPKGTETSKLFGNQQIKIIKSGEEDIGKWVTFEVNLVEDYRRMFGDNPPKNPIAIIILSDGDSTGSYVKADYDDFMLKAKK